ncbi:MAG: hypothetical protein ABTQ24_09310 [Azonexus sp.]|jgi:hypothetical protein
MLTPENIVQMLDRYVELKAQADRLDALTHAGVPHDTSAYLGAVYELPKLEDELIEAGIFRHTAGQVVALVSRKGEGDE